MYFDAWAIEGAISRKMKKGLCQEMNEKWSISHKAWRSVYVGTHLKYGLYRENEKNGSINEYRNIIKILYLYFMFLIFNFSNH